MNFFYFALLFAAISRVGSDANAQAHSGGGTFTGRAFISQKQIEYSETEMTRCLARLEYGQSKTHIGAVCNNVLHEAESEYLEQWYQRKHVEPSVPSSFAMKVLNERCFLNSQTTSMFHKKLVFHVSIQCPIGTSKKELQAGIMELYSRYPKRYLSVFMPLSDTQAEPAMKLKARISLDIKECLSNLAVSVDEPSERRQLTCKLARGRELDDLNQTRGVVNSTPVSIKTNLKGSSNPDVNTISISLDSFRVDSHFIYIHYYDWDRKYPLITDEVRKEFARVLSHQKFFIVEAAVSAPVKTSFPKVPLLVTEIDLFDGDRWAR